jgi:hypothetical protein
VTPTSDPTLATIWVSSSNSLPGPSDSIVPEDPSASTADVPPNPSDTIAPEQQSLPRARDVEHVAFSGQILRVPFVIHPDAQPSDLDFSSYVETINAPVLPSSSVALCLGYYGAPPKDIRLSPLSATDLSGLSPTYIQIAGADSLRDNGFAYAE